MEASPFKETTTAIKRPAKLPPPTENNHEVEGGNRQDDYSDHEVDNLDWEVLEQPPDSDAKTKLDNTSRLPSSLTCEQRQNHEPNQDNFAGNKQKYLESEIEETGIGTSSVLRIIVQSYDVGLQCRTHPELCADS